MASSTLNIAERIESRTALIGGGGLGSVGLPLAWVFVEAGFRVLGFLAFEPGRGLAGHCIPTDPFYLSWLVRRHGVERESIESAGSKICILGVLYTRNATRNVTDGREKICKA
jgi:UDP-N-acetyl-D-mannosaminuronate dehydrogenase